MSDPEVVVRLLAAIDEREAKAQEARNQAIGGEWLAVVNAGDGDCAVVTRRGAVVASGGLFEVGPHIAANDPQAVLRLCQSHRDIVARHSPVTIQVHDPDKYGHTSPTDSADELACRRCGTPSEYPVPWPCADLIDLARGYGVEES